MAKIGLEVHVQLNTATKLFCGCRNEPNPKPNVNVCPTCLGLPGSKPRINEKAIELGYRIAFITNSKLSHKMFFSRKSYFYPDMSKNFQITQYEIPLATGGHFDVEVKGKRKRVRLIRVHLEEDPARLVHVGGGITTAKYVLADYNRSGVPLCEIVTEPDFKTAEEVVAFMKKLLSYLQHIQVFDVKKGKWRADVNVSVPGGNRSEIKNVGSIKDMEKSIRFEIMRQTHLVKFGKKVNMETRTFDSETGKTYTLRSKEEEIDYGYIFEPDLTSFEMSKDYFKKLDDSLPELPEEIEKRFRKDYGLNHEQASILTYADPALAGFFEKCAKTYNDHRKLANWLIVEVLGFLNSVNKEFYETSMPLRKKQFIKFLELMDSGRMTGRIGKELIGKFIASGDNPEKLLEKESFTLIKDELKVRRIVKETVSESPKAVSDYKSGKEKAVHFIVGAVLKKTRLQVDPETVKKMVVEEIS